MPDITKCKDETCPLKDMCYRYTVEPNELWQSYFADSPRNGNECEMFWGEHSQQLMNKLNSIVKGEEA